VVRPPAVQGFADLRGERVGPQTKRGEVPPLSMAVAPGRIDSKSPLSQRNSQLFMSGTKIFRREVSMFTKILVFNHIGAVVSEGVR